MRRFGRVARRVSEILNLGELVENGENGETRWKLGGNLVKLGETW